MKIKKYLSVAIGLFDSTLKKHQSKDAEALYQVIVQLEEYLSKKGFSYQKEITNQLSTASLHLTVLNEKKEGLISQVKFFPQENNNTFESFHKTDGVINFIRAYTGPNGQLSIDLPVEKDTGRRYLIEISKGSEYEVLNYEIYIKAQEETASLQILSRIADFQTLGWHPGDLHHHSIYSSPVHGGTDDVIESPLEVAYSMQAAGLTYGALSDHHNILNHCEWEQTKSDDFTPLISKEISTSNGHVMALNVEKDVIYNIPKGEDRTEQFLRDEFVRVTDEIRSWGGLAQLNHPTDLSPAISLNPKFIDMIEIFDTMEIWNGSNPMLDGTTNQSAAKLWVSLLEEGRFIAATSGSDTHNTYANDYHQVLDRVSWLVGKLEGISKDLSLDLQDGAKYLTSLYEQTTPILEKWAEKSLGTGCVKTYVHLNEKNSPVALLRALKKGNSFLTNGPILIPTIDGSHVGEILRTDKSHVTIDLTLISNQPLGNLYIYASGGKCVTIPLVDTATTSKKRFDYSQQIKDFNIGDAKWLFFVAASDFTNLAITNPIFFE